MKPLILFMFAVLLLTSNLQAQTKKTKDQAAIKQLCGCFKVGLILQKPLITVKMKTTNLLK